MKEYRKRVAESELDDLLHTFGAVLIEGVTGCGKTETARRFAKSEMGFKDTKTSERLLFTARNNPLGILDGAKPRFIDEWQDAPSLWDAARTEIDDKSATGFYIFTSSTAQHVHTAHTGTGRIARMQMRPMSLYESGESNGEVSINDLFEDPASFTHCKGDMTMDDYAYAACRGGWPESVCDEDKKRALKYPAHLLKRIFAEELPHLGKGKNADFAMAALRSYSKDICGQVDRTAIQEVSTKAGIGRNTAAQYIDALKSLFLLEDIPAWRVPLKTRTSVKAAGKRNVTDPSLCAAALKLSPESFKTDFLTLQKLFECMCIRDLKAYCPDRDSEITYYSDRSGLAFYRMELDWKRHVLFEFELGGAETDKAVKRLCEAERLISEYDEKSDGYKIGPPTLKIVLTGTEYGFRTKEGVLIIPLGCLKN